MAQREGARYSRGSGYWFGGPNTYSIFDKDGKLLKDKVSESDFYKNLIADVSDPSVKQWLSNLSDRDLVAYLGDDEYWKKEMDVLGLKSHDYDINSLLSDLQNLNSIQSLYGSMPQEPDYESIRANANSSIDAENAELFRLLDEESASNKAMYQGQMRDLNDQYGNVSSNILSQNYQQNAALTDSVQSEMSKSRRNALEAGASAGMRLASNINTLMSTQNQQNANAMQTSNNLAQMMLQQRQAAQGLQGDYSNYMNNAGQQRRGIIGGSAERKNSYARDSIDTERGIYQQKLGEWENKYNSAAGTNTLADKYRGYLTNSQYNQ